MQAVGPLGMVYLRTKNTQTVSRKAIGQPGNWTQQHIAIASSLPFQLAKKVLPMKLADPLDVAEDDVPLAAQRLRYVLAQQLLRVVLDHVLQRADVVAFCANHFAHDQ